ncbi:CHASE2 domain-containing protein [Lusitaniella coriacea]|uniref:CHASE2 domain-containing protein n=1 Tax=Lusitaniella coriacea TaxID=1983105 RepID=UPI003CEC54B2
MDRKRVARWLKRERRVWLTSGAVAGSVILLRYMGLFQSWELAAFDRLFHFRPPATTDTRILIVEIDENDLQDAGKWPVPDRLMAQLLESVNGYRPRVIGLDVYRDLPVEPGHQELNAAFETIPNLIGIEQLEDKESFWVLPPPILQRKQQVGFNNILVDADGQVRRFLLYSHKNGEAYTSFALKLAQIYLEGEGIRPQAATDVNPAYLQLGKTVFRPFRPSDGGYIRADAKGYQVISNFHRPESFTKVKMGDVLAGEVAPELIRDRAILIGSTAPSLKDKAYIPYSTNWQGSAKPIYGVELHANIVSQILSAALAGRPLMRTIPEGVEWLWIVVWSGMGAIIVRQSRSLVRSSILTLSAIALLSSSVYLSFSFGWWIPSIPPLISLIASSAILTGYLAHKQEELKRSKEFLQSIIDSIPDPIFVKDRHHRWMLLNQAFCQFSGYPIEDLLGKSDRDIFPSKTAHVLWSQDRLVFETSEAREDEAEFVDAKGNAFLIATNRSLHKDAAGNLFLVGVIRDITERKRIEEELRRETAELMRFNAELKLSAYYDELTGLPNKKHFDESFAKALGWGEKHNQLVGLLFLDLDGFKQVNDTLGHEMGNLLLKAVAGRIQNCLRGSDLVARWAGDEFTAILPGIKQAEDVAIIAEKIVFSLSQPFMLENRAVIVGVSIGSSIYPENGKTPDLLIHKADTAMYQAKELGRNQHQVAR